MHCTVIGAGLGGLTAGALLSKAGHQVHVLEAHDRPGGCASTFMRHGVTIEATLHEIDGLDSHDPKKKIFQALDVFRNIDFLQTDSFYRFVDSRHDIDIVLPHGKGRYVKALTDTFPDEAHGIRKFINTVLTARQQMTQWPLVVSPALSDYILSPVRLRTVLRYYRSTVGEVLDKFIDSDACKLALTANLGYYHDDPYELSFPFFAAAQGSFIQGGSYYIRGGSQSLSDHLVDVIQSTDGSIEYNRRAVDIRVDAGSVSAVRHINSTQNKNPMTTDTDAVIANTAIPNVASNLLSDPYASKLSSQIAGFDLAPSLSTLYLIFEPALDVLGHSQYSTKITSNVSSYGQFADLMTGSYADRPLNFTDYSQVDANLAPDNRSVGSVAFIDSYHNWTGLSDTEYQRKKDHVTDILIRRLTEVIPEIDDAILYSELATPLTIENYTRNPSGTTYGFAQYPDQSTFSREFDSPVDGLEFGSAWTNPGGGFTGAILGGASAASNLSSRVDQLLISQT